MAGLGLEYLTVTLTGGHRLTLHPVLAYGVRYVGFDAPAAAITRITAYGQRGEIASTVPMHDRDSLLAFGIWLRPGQPGLPQPLTHSCPGRRPPHLRADAPSGAPGRMRCGASVGCCDKPGQRGHPPASSGVAGRFTAALATSPGPG